LQAEQYDELIELALSDDLLPENPINARNIRVYRLQFAFKAALKQKQYADATKLAFRAGEEVAGDTRQLKLLFENIDLIAPFQSNERIQELSHRRLLSGDWEGSENIYSASLLSCVDDYKGEARGYLRAGEHWLRLYFDARKKNKKNGHHHDRQLTDQDIVEMATTYLNLFGIEDAVKFILSWNPQEVTFRVASLFSKRLVDKAKFALIESALSYCEGNPSFVIAISNELMSVGRHPKKEVLKRSLSLITHSKTKLGQPQPFYEKGSNVEAILSFLEACTIENLSAKKINTALKLYIEKEPTTYSINSDHSDGSRSVFMRSIMIKAATSNEFNLDVNSLLPKSWLKDEEKYNQKQEVERCKEVIGILLP